jgi:hypothetical protein
MDALGHYGEWYWCPLGTEPFDRSAWHAAVREVATVTGDRDVVRLMDWYDETERAMHAAGLFVGDPKPDPQHREALHANLDRLLGIVDS